MVKQAKLDKYTIYGVGARAQSQIIDLTGEGVSPTVRKDKPTVTAYVLPSTIHKYTAFVKGKQIYWGHSVRECIKEIAEFLQLAEIKLPNKFNQYK